MKVSDSMERLTYWKDKEHAVLDMNAKNVRKATEKLAEYEDAEEQGLLLRLPCKVGDTVYHIWNVDDKPEIQKITISTLTNVVANLENGNFGKYIFLTRKEAEEEIREIAKDNLAKEIARIGYTDYLDAKERIEQTIRKLESEG